VPKKDIVATHMSREGIKDQLRAVAQHYREADQFTKTLLTCVDVLANGVGGMIVSVIHEDVLQGQLRFDYLDGGLHTRCFRDVCRNVGDDNFAIMLELLTAHNQSDKWEKQELEALCKKIPEAQKYKELLGQPKDGAITISRQGSVKGAAMYLKYPSEKFQLRTQNGAASGTRHASALGFAEHLCTQFEGDLLPGVVFARSDGGGAHVFIPQPWGEPLVLHFDTFSLPSVPTFTASHVPGGDTDGDKVEYVDTDGDRTNFARNGFGSIDYWVNGRTKLRCRTELIPTGHTLHLKGIPAGKWCCSGRKTFPEGRVVDEAVALFDRSAKVEFVDTDDDRVKFAKNGFGSIDYWVNGRVKLRCLTELVPAGSTLHMKGSPAGKWGDTHCTTVPEGRLADETVALFARSVPDHIGPRQSSAPCIYHAM
jgi:hypothetical protein